MHGALKDFLPIVEQLTRLPGKLLARTAALLSLLSLILGWFVVRSSSGFFSWLPLLIGIIGFVSAVFFGWRRFRLEKAVSEWMDDVVNTFDGEGEAKSVDYSAMYEGEAPSPSLDLVIDEDGNPAGSDNRDTQMPAAGSQSGSQDASDLAQRRHDAMIEATQQRDTWMPRVEAAQRAAIAAAGGIVNAPYLKDDLRVTIASAILTALAIPTATFFIFVAFFSLL